MECYYISYICYVLHLLHPTSATHSSKLLTMWLVSTAGLCTVICIYVLIFLARHLVDSSISLSLSYTAKLSSNVWSVRYLTCIFSVQNQRVVVSGGIGKVIFNPRLSKYLIVFVFEFTFIFCLCHQFWTLLNGIVQKIFLKKTEFWTFPTYKLS